VLHLPDVRGDGDESSLDLTVERSLSSKVVRTTVAKGLIIAKPTGS
jgi:hypothetical protein